MDLPTRPLHGLRFHLWLLAIACWLGLAAAAQAAPRITIVDGDAVVIDGERALQAAEGLALGAEAIVRTGSRLGLLRIEWPDGHALDLGPDTQAVIEPGGFGQRGGRAPALYLLNGWAKLSSPEGTPSPGALTPRLDLQPFKGVAVLLASATEHWLFAESGGGNVVERDARPATPLALPAGGVYLREGQAKGSLAARPTPAQMQRVPRGFRDRLPLRLAQFKDRSAQARPAPAPSYAELRDWLTAERALRRNATKRFAQRATDPAFRAALAGNLSAHPEWEPVLFPERFTKPATPPR